VLSRYARQLLLPEIGEEGQRRLAQSRVVILGCGALGSMQAQALARAGVGHIRLVDRDRVDLTNIHRQVLYNEEDAAQAGYKAEVAAAKVRAINSTVRVESHVLSVDASNVGTLLDGMDVALDGFDNANARGALNAACLCTGIPWVFGGVMRHEGLAMAILPHKSACLHCAFPGLATPQESTEPLEGIFPVLPAIIGGVQATLALRLLLDAPNVAGTLYRLDLWRMRLGQSTILRRAGCPSCGAGNDCSK